MSVKYFGSDALSKLISLIKGALNGKADKVTNATAGNLAGLDASGNLVDSGIGLREDATATGNPAVFSTISEQLSKQTTVNIEPIQDLNGYDKPWSGGAGKNLLNLTATSETINGVTLTVYSDGTLVANGTATTHIFYNVKDLNLSAGEYILNGSPTGGGLYNNFVLFVYVGSGNNQYDLGNGVQFTGGSNTHVRLAIYNGYTANNLTFKPMIRLASVVDPTFAPYTNICPISGLNSVVVERCGRNVFNEQMVLGDINGTTGADIDSSSYLRSDYVLINPALTYYLRTPTTIRKWFYFYDKNKQYLGESTRLRGNTNETFTIPSGAYYMRFLIQVSEYGSSSYQNNVCMNVSDPSFNGQYVPFESNDIQTTTLPTTVYGGTLDLTNGRLVVDRAIVTFDGSDDEGWNATNGKSCETLLLASMIKKTANNQIANIKCNRLSAGTANNIYSGTIGIAVDNAGYICVDIDGTTHTTAEYKTWLSNNPLQVVYELATPVITTITPSSLSLLKGLNVVSTNGDTVEVTFNQGSLATLEDVADANAFKFDKADVANMEGDTASKAYYVGNYMLREDGFYRVTANIASGAAITNNNTTKTTVGAELEENHSDILNLATDLNNPLIIDRNISPGATDIEDLNNYALFKFIEWKNDSNPDGTILCSLYVFFSGELRNLISDRGYMKLLFTNTELTIARNGSSITISRDSSSSSDYKITVFLQNRFSV